MVIILLYYTAFWRWAVLASYLQYVEDSQIKQKKKFIYF